MNPAYNPIHFKIYQVEHTSTMGVVRTRRVAGRRKSVKAQRPWSRTVRSYFTKPRLDRTLASIRPRMGVFGFSQSYRTRLRYVETIGLISSAGSVARNVFSPQNCFDPNVTGTGHQPMYFDQLTAIYARYKVHGATIRVTFSATSEVAGTAIGAVGIIAGSAQTISSDVNTNMEDNHGVSTILNGRNGNSGQKILYLTYQPKRDLGISVDDDSLVTPINTGAGTYYWNVWWSDLSAPASSNCTATVEISYDVEFVDNINIAGS